MCLALLACGDDDGPALDGGPDDAAAIPDAGADAGGGTTTCSAELPDELATRGRWDEGFTVAGVTGLDGYTPVVRDVAAAPDGSAIVVGYFRWSGTTRALGIARVDGDALVAWQGAGDLPPSPEGYAAVAIAPDGAVALATYQRGGTREGRIVRWRDGEVEELGRFTGNVRTLRFVGDRLYALGTLAIVDGPRHVAIFDGDGWAGLPGGDPDGPAFDLLERADGSLVFGGEFTRIGGTAAQRVAALDEGVWSALDVPESLRVITLAEHEGTLLAGGVFWLAVANRESAGVARRVGDAWERLGGGVSFGGALGDASGVVAELVVDAHGVLAIGCFDRAGGEPAAGFARWSGDAWRAIATDRPGGLWFTEGACGFELPPEVVFEMGPVQRATVVGAGESERVIVGGELSGMGDVASQSVLAIAGEDVEALGAPGAGLSGQVVDLARGGPSCAVHALVAATHLGGTPFDGSIAILEGSTWRPAAPALPADTQCSQLVVDPDGRLFVACTRWAGETPRAVVLRSEDGGAWRVIGDELVGPALAIELGPEGRPWIGVGSEPGRVARVLDDSVELLPGAFEGPILAISAHGADVVVGGGFLRIDEREVSRIARWDGATWQPLGDGSSAAISALAVGEDVVYAATHDEGDPSRRVLGRFAGGTWTELATPERGLGAPLEGTSHTFTDLELQGDTLIAVGYVWPEDGGRNVYVYQDDRLRVLGGGVGAMSVDAVATTDDAVILGGAIAEVGAGDATRPSIGVARWLVGE
jgi:hypothetical protein